MSSPAAYLYKMNNKLHPILTKNKSVESYERNAYVADCEKFHIEFIEYLTNTVSKQLSRPVEDIKWFFDRYLADPSLGLEIDYDFLYVGERTEEQEYQAKAYDLKEAIQNKLIFIEGIHFPAANHGIELDYQHILALIKSLIFINCQFYGEQLFIEGDERFFASNYSFERCVFHENWKVTETRPPAEEVALFTKCIFLEQVEIIGAGLSYSDLNEFDCIFRSCDLKDVYVYGLDISNEMFFFSKKGSSSLRKLRVVESSFSSPMSLNNIAACDSIEIMSTQFKSCFSLINSTCDNILIDNTDFNSQAGFSESKFGSIAIYNTIFRGIANFQGCQFGTPDNTDQISTLNYVTFYSFINFSSAKFNKPLNLGNTNQQQPNFLNATFTKQAAAGTDRETFRIIKHSFDAVGNHVEASKYFALEMQAYRRELKNEKAEGHRRERVLLSANAIISNHGQNYLYALFWFGVIICIIGLVLVNDSMSEQLIDTRFTGPLVWQCIRDWMNTLALGFLPLSSLFKDREHLAAFLLFSTLILSGVTWHLLVAVRRHSKR